MMKFKKKQIFKITQKYTIKIRPTGLEPSSDQSDILTCFKNNVFTAKKISFYKIIRT